MYATRILGPQLCREEMLDTSEFGDACIFVAPRRFSREVTVENEDSKGSLSTVLFIAFRRTKQALKTGPRVLGNIGEGHTARGRLENHLLILRWRSSKDNAPGTSAQGIAP